MRQLVLLLLIFPLWAQAQTTPDSTTAHPVLTLAPADTTVALPPASAPADTSAIQVAADTTRPGLQGLSAEERRLRGRADARQTYKPKGMFWAGLGMGVAGAVVLSTPAGLPGAMVGGLGGTMAIAAAGPRPEKLRASAPHPELLQDPDYHKGYKQQASNQKVARMTLGWGAGTLASLTTIVALAVLLLSGGWS